jgi:23S rRNA (adenine1618-N6)-methyltransferase
MTKPNAKAIFKGIIKAGESFDMNICNPPFHTLAAQANAGSVRKINNLTGKKPSKPILNFAGKKANCGAGAEKKNV